MLIQEGYLKVTNFSFKKENTALKEDKENENESADEKCDAELTNLLMHLKREIPYPRIPTRSKKARLLHPSDIPRAASF